MTGAPLDLKAATIVDFEPLVGETFRLTADQESTNLTLSAVEPSSHTMPGARAGFSLFFDGPPEVVIQQQIHLLSNEKTGPIEVFLVPISGDAQRRRYQAVFN